MPLNLRKDQTSQRLRKTPFRLQKRATRADTRKPIRRQNRLNNHQFAIPRSPKDGSLQRTPTDLQDKQRKLQHLKIQPKHEIFDRKAQK